MGCQDFYGKRVFSAIKIALYDTHTGGTLARQFTHIFNDEELILLLLYWIQLFYRVKKLLRFIRRFNLML